MASFIDQWEEQLPKTLEEFSHLAKDDAIDLTYGILATAVLWYVKDASVNDTARQALDAICGDQAALLFDILRTWTDDKPSAARDLSSRIEQSPELKAVTDKLLKHFERHLIKTEALIDKRKIDLKATSIEIAGDVSGVAVNIGGKQYIYGDVVKNVYHTEIVYKSYIVQVFTRWDQTVIVVLGLMALILMVIAIVDYMNQPGKPEYIPDNPDHPTFHVAVARFNSNAPTNEYSMIAQNTIFNAIDGTLPNLRVTRRNMPVILSEREAAAHAEKYNIHMVIYGNVTVTGDTMVIEPKFYVDPTLKPDLGELTGEQGLPLYLVLSPTQQVDILIPGSAIRKDFENKAQIVTEFVKALTYLSTENYDSALVSIQDTVNLAQNYQPESFPREEVIYLYASTITRINAKDLPPDQMDSELQMAENYARKALAINDHYARAYIALGYVPYEQGLRDQSVARLKESIRYFEDAVRVLMPSDTILVKIWAHMALGNAYFILYQITGSTSADYAAQVLSNYQIVIDEFERIKDYEQSEFVREYAAFAALTNGAIHERDGDLEAACDAFDRALSITHDSKMKQDAQELKDKNCSNSS